MKQKVIQAYKGKILAIRNYSSSKRNFVTDDFIALDKLENILDEIYTGESDITPAGKSFLEAYYGFSQLADTLATRNKLLEFDNTSAGAICSWLKEVTPMEIVSFIAESRGEIQKGQQLAEELLPPSSS